MVVGLKVPISGRGTWRPRLLAGPQTTIIVLAASFKSCTCVPFFLHFFVHTHNPKISFHALALSLWYFVIGMFLVLSAVLTHISDCLVSLRHLFLLRF